MMCAKEDKGGGMMERLTEKIGNTNCVKGCGSNCKYGFQHCRTEDWENCKTIDDVIDKLAEYEGLEEQGRLIKLPCKIGTKVYDITWWDNVQEKVVVKGKAYYRTVHKHKVTKLPFTYSDIDNFGKTVFLTKSEADQKLKEMERD